MPLFLVLWSALCYLKKMFLLLWSALCYLRKKKIVEHAGDALSVCMFFSSYFAVSIKLNFLISWNCIRSYSISKRSRLQFRPFNFAECHFVFAKLIYSATVDWNSVKLFLTELCPRNREPISQNIFKSFQLIYLHL